MLPLIFEGLFQSDLRVICDGEYKVDLRCYESADAVLCD